VRSTPGTRLVFSLPLLTNDQTVVRPKPDNLQASRTVTVIGLRSFSVSGCMSDTIAVVQGKSEFFTRSNIRQHRRVVIPKKIIVVASRRRRNCDGWRLTVGRSTERPLPAFSTPPLAEMNPARRNLLRAGTGSVMEGIGHYPYARCAPSSATGLFFWVTLLPAAAAAQLENGRAGAPHGPT
jgi:hypothetical protein